MSLSSWVLRRHLQRVNQSKILFTPGPASLAYENLVSLGPAFGRGDSEYNKLEFDVLEWLKSISGQAEIVRVQGSATLALEIALENFVTGKVLVVQTGYYSNRLLKMMSSRADIHLTSVDTNGLAALQGSFDWVVACPTETSTGYFTDIKLLGILAKRLKSELFLDATASIGLEEGHGQADVVCFSSCKGLFGLTGAAFIGFNKSPIRVPSNFSLSLDTHRNRQTTGPYHAIQSLSLIVKNHEKLKKSVFMNKEKMIENYPHLLVHPMQNQPKLCTAVKSKVRGKNPAVILYESRLPNSHTIICHLGEVHLGEKAKGKILEYLEFY